jgi:hypothetical protein
MTTPSYSTDQNFFFATPLYERQTLTAGQIKHLKWEGMKFDGYCYFCNKLSTFERSSHGATMSGYKDDFFMRLNEIANITFTCARDDSHIVHFSYHLDGGSIKKIGQYPSFADIAIDESKAYTKLLPKEDIAEFHKSIGLAAHGVGIGSYVYLRRIFERLIYKRFAEYKDAERWSEDEFKKLRMKEKIELLADHLPEFLVKNAKIYSILSLGVHELNEADCLAFFPILRQSTVWILEQDKKKREELAQEKALQQAIEKFAPPTRHEVGELPIAQLMVGDNAPKA